MHKERFALILALIAAAALSRLLPHPQNVSPVAAIALFAGATLASRALAFIIPLAAMMLADIIIGFHSTMLFVYVGMVITVALGMGLRGKTSALRVAGASLAASVIFFAVTNLGVWLMEGIYPHTLAGLGTCFIAAIPFFAHSLLGDLFFVGLLFGVFALSVPRGAASEINPRAR